LDIIQPLTALTKKDLVFKWSIEANIVFEELKRMFITTLVLASFNLDRITILETNSSSWYIEGTLF
jgi:hypothetical protein